MLAGSENLTARIGQVVASALAAVQFMTVR
jgi:hypothetical protein